MAVVIVLIRTLIGLRCFEKRTITKRLIRVPVVNPRICTVWLCGMTFAAPLVEKDESSSGQGGFAYEEAPRFHSSFEFIGSYRNSGFSKCITTEATDGIR